MFFATFTPVKKIKKWSEIKKEETDKRREGETVSELKSIRKWSWTASPLANENRLISEELSSKHHEESTKQLVSSLSSSAKPITASDVGLFKANQSQEVFSPLPFSPPAYRCWLGNESLLKWGGMALTAPAAAVYRQSRHREVNYTSLFLPIILFVIFQQCRSLQSFGRSLIAPLPLLVTSEQWLIYESKWASNLKMSHRNNYRGCFQIISAVKIWRD